VLQLQGMILLSRLKGKTKMLVFMRNMQLSSAIAAGTQALLILASITVNVQNLSP
jgi:hypothetical protein